MRVLEDNISKTGAIHLVVTGFWHERYWFAERSFHSTTVLDEVMFYKGIPGD